MAAQGPIVWENFRPEMSPINPKDPRHPTRNKRGAPLAAYSAGSFMVFGPCTARSLGGNEIRVPGDLPVGRTPTGFSGQYGHHPRMEYRKLAP